MRIYGILALGLVFCSATPASALVWKNGSQPQNNQCPVISRANITIATSGPIAGPNDAEHVMGDLAGKVTKLAVDNGFVIGNWERKKHYSVSANPGKDAQGRPVSSYMLTGSLIYDDFDNVAVGNKFLELLSTNGYHATLSEYQGQSPWCTHKTTKQ